MRIGFVGAGKVGCSLGKYFAIKGASVSGYYSRTLASAKAAAEFVGTNYYESLETVVDESDCLFFTVNDAAIEDVWNKVKEMNISGKIICHCSGAKSASVFEGIDEREAFGFSLHPISPFSSKYESYKNVEDAYFTLEGENIALSKMKEFLGEMGLSYSLLSGDNKVKYHGACVFASNLAIGLFDDATKLLCDVGFTKEDAKRALKPLILQNITAFLEKDAKDALTGPVERGDVATVEAHLSVLDNNQKEVYRSLSKELLGIAKEKHKEKDYGNMESLLG